MKAVVCTKYGAPEVLEIREVTKPKINPKQILVKIAASCVNSGDVRVRSIDIGGFMKIIMHLVLGISKPRKPILGTVFSGIIEAGGNEVNGFKVGDKVFGMTGFGFGTHAEYISVNQNSNVLLMPKNATFEEAAAIIFGGHTAIFFLEKARITDGVNKKVLILGATGSVGAAAIQIAKYYKADITAVCSSEGQELVRNLGVNKLVLYDKAGIKDITEKFDIIFDAIGKYKRSQFAELLTRNGIYKSVNSYAIEKKEHLQLLKELFEKGDYLPTIDKTFRLAEIVEAHRYVDTGRKKGNVVLKIQE